jgi:hypothetical protein
VLHPSNLVPARNPGLLASPTSQPLASAGATTPVGLSGRPGSNPATTPGLCYLALASLAHCFRRLSVSPQHLLQRRSRPAPCRSRRTIFRPDSPPTPRVLQLQYRRCRLRRPTPSWTRQAQTHTPPGQLLHAHLPFAVRGLPARLTAPFRTRRASTLRPSTTQEPAPRCLSSHTHRRCHFANPAPGPTPSAGHNRRLRLSPRGLSRSGPGPWIPDADLPRHHSVTGYPPHAGVPGSRRGPATPPPSPLVPGRQAHTAAPAPGGQTRAEAPVASSRLDLHGAASAAFATLPPPLPRRRRFSPVSSPRPGRTASAPLAHRLQSLPLLEPAPPRPHRSRRGRFYPHPTHPVRCATHRRLRGPRSARRPLHRRQLTGPGPRSTTQPPMGSPWFFPAEPPSPLLF